MKNLILIASCIITIYSCVEVKFEQAQPAKTPNLKSFPSQLHGKYFVSVSDTTNESDTLIIAEKYFTEVTLTSKKDSTLPKKKVFLSDSLVLKEMDNYYILSFQDKKTWTSLVIKPIENIGYSILWINGKDENSVEKMKQIAKVKTIKDKEGEIESYILNPKKSVFKKLLLKKGVFTQLYQLKKLQD